MLLRLLRRLSPRTRIIVGVVTVAAGFVLAAVAAAVAAGLVVHGVALAVIGAVLWTSGIVSKKRARLAGQLSVASHINA